MVRKLLPNLNHITEDLKPLAIEVKKLTPDPANAMDHDERSIDEIKSSLVAFGQRKPIVCQVAKSGILIKAGNGTYEAAKQLGWEHIAAVKIKEDNTTATGYAIADNRTAQFGKWNPESLDKLFKSFDGTQFSSESLGWNQDELNEVLKSPSVIPVELNIDIHEKGSRFSFPINEELNIKIKDQILRRYELIEEFFDKEPELRKAVWESIILRLEKENDESIIDKS